MKAAAPFLNCFKGRLDEKWQNHPFELNPTYYVSGRPIRIHGQNVSGWGSNVWSSRPYQTPIRLFLMVLSSLCRVVAKIIMQTKDISTEVYFIYFYRYFSKTSVIYLSVLTQLLIGQYQNGDFISKQEERLLFTYFYFPSDFFFSNGCVQLSLIINTVF